MQSSNFNNNHPSSRMPREFRPIPTANNVHIGNEINDVYFQTEIQ